MAVANPKKMVPPSPGQQKTLVAYMSGGKVQGMVGYYPNYDEGFNAGRQWLNNNGGRTYSIGIFQLATILETELAPIKVCPVELGLPVLAEVAAGG